MSYQSQVENMMRNFEQIDNKQSIPFIPKQEDYCLMIDGKSDGYIYHYITIVKMINDGFVLKPSERFVRMTEMTWQQLQDFLTNKYENTTDN